MTTDVTSGAFDIGEGFTQGDLSAGLSLGPLESQYQELFAEALEDGVITTEERARLEKAADNLGLDRSRLFRLEQAMVESYELRHTVRVVERYEEPPASLAPIQIAEAGDAGRTILEKRVLQLEARVRELEEELRIARANVNVEVDLAALSTAAEVASEDPADVWRRIRRDPTNPRPYHELYAIYDARGETDRKWCVSQALVALDDADEGERATFEDHRPAGLIAPRASVTQQAFLAHVLHPEEELLTGQIFGVIAPAVLVSRVTALRRDKKLHVPAAESRQEPAKATLTAVRALTWGAAILGLAPPPIFVEKDRDVGYEHIPGVPPVTVVGGRVLSGLTPFEQAFLVGRHLCWYRQERFVRTLFSSVADLEDLFLAALVIGSPSLPIAADMRQRVEPIARAIEPLLDPPHLDALREHFLRFVEEGGRTNLQRWSAATERTACRAGMLLCNDLPSAIDILSREEGRLGDHSKDLLAFVTSETYFELRAELGIALPS